MNLEARFAEAVAAAEAAHRTRMREIEETHRRIVEELARTEDEVDRLVLKFDLGTVDVVWRADACEELEQALAAARLKFGVYPNGYPREWFGSDDPAEQFCVLIQMCRKMAARGELPEAVRWMAAYRRGFRDNLFHLGHSIH